MGGAPAKGAIESVEDLSPFIDREACRSRAPVGRWSGPSVRGSPVGGIGTGFGLRAIRLRTDGPAAVSSRGPLCVRLASTAPGHRSRTGIWPPASHLRRHMHGIRHGPGAHRSCETPWRVRAQVCCGDGPILGGCGTVGARSVRRPQHRRALDMARSIRSCPTGCAKCRMGRRPGWCWKHLQHQPCAPPLCRHVTANTRRPDLGRPRKPGGTANWAITREPSSRCYTASHAWMDVTRTSGSSTVTRGPETGGDTKARYRSYFTPSIPGPVNRLR